MKTVNLLFSDIHGEPMATLELTAERPDSLKEQTEAEAAAHGEQTILLEENATYQYRLKATDKTHRIRPRGATVIPSAIENEKDRQGRIETGSRAGGLALELETAEGETVATARVEVQTTKLTYREEYRAMLDAITDRCTDLLLDLNSPVSLQLLPDPSHDSQTLAQRFAFLKSLLSGALLRDSVRRIIASPHSRLISEIEDRDIRKGFPADPAVSRQIASRNPRVSLPDFHPLAARLVARGIHSPSVPLRLSVSRNVDSIDTAENRFVKHALEVFSATLQKIETASESLRREAGALRAEIDGYLMHSFFREIAAPDRLPLGSTVLQRKAGYREILSIWLKFNMAARLVWPGGDEIFGQDDVYGGNNRDMGRLYEYWLFFVLLDQAEKHFSTGRKATSELLTTTADGFGLTLKSGKNATITGTIKRAGRVLNVRFDYNRTFAFSDSPDKSGTWTRQMRPDFTFTFWPEGMSEAEGEAADLLVHIHFDSKYRAEKLKEVFGDDSDLLPDGKAGRGKTYKRNDLLVVHTYRDAIRRTAGAYILYPGDDSKRIFKQYHEILPGLGAFAVRPTVKGDENIGVEGIAAVSNFFDDVVDHLCDRASRREQMTFQENRIRTLSPALAPAFPVSYPEKYKRQRLLPPAETGIIVASFDLPELLSEVTETIFLELTGEADLKALFNAIYVLNSAADHGQFYRIERREITTDNPAVALKQNAVQVAANGVFLCMDVVQVEGDWPEISAADSGILPEAGFFALATMAGLFAEK